MENLKELSHDDDIIAYKEESEDSEELEADEEQDNNLPLEGSPVYPRIFIGDSAKPLQGQYSETEYVDDNISRTWLGLLNSFYG